ncbi:MAG: vWA domain-containing protein [Pseudomonadota bacterium]
MSPLRHPALITMLVLAGLASLPVHASPRYAHPLSQLPKPAHAPATIELLFVLDTTGSMGEMLEGAKTKIWGIVNDVLQRQGNTRARIRVGLVAYRDRGDAYVTRITPLSDNLDVVYAQLMRYEANGGGDGPEDVRSALADGLRAGGWSAPGPRTSQVMFLVGDAPPHDDYQNIRSTSATAREAAQRGIIVNAIQCGEDSQTERAWRAVARQGGGDYFAIAQDGGVEAIETPYDGPLAKLGEQIGGTYMAYGSASVRERSQSAQIVMETRVSADAPPPARAERAVNKALNDKAYDERDLVQKAESGKVAVAGIAEAELPDSLRKLAPAKRQEALDTAVAERKAIREKIVTLAKQREQYIAEQRRKKGGGKAGLDEAISSALARQIK